MYFHNPGSTRSILARGEHATVLRSKSGGEHGTKKPSSNENFVKTPHGNRTKGGVRSKSGQTTQRRRRAFGDISNRKAVGGAGGGKGGAASTKKAPSDGRQAASKLGKSEIPCPLPSAKHRAAQVKFSKTPSTNKSGLGVGGSGLKSEGSGRAQRASSADHDGAFGFTTRFCNEDVADERRSPFDLVPEEELTLVSDLCEELSERRTEESREAARLELERGEERLRERIREVHALNERDIQEMGAVATCDFCAEEDEEWDFLNEKLPWEEEDVFEG